MATRSTGFAQLFGNSPQQAMDMALIATASSLKARIPFLNIFDGFRTSHELNQVQVVDDEVIRQMIDEEDVNKQRQRSLNPAHPFVRGTAQNPDVFFQSREAANTYYHNVPEIVEGMMQRFQDLTGRSYKLFEYFGHPRAERIIVIMGSGSGPVHEVTDYLNQSGQRVGYVHVHLYRPFSLKHFIQAIPATVEVLQFLIAARNRDPLVSRCTWM
jgi:pyruvate-ferredoxin/flavodoxin oxidoreductase